MFGMLVKGAAFEGKVLRTIEDFGENLMIIDLE